MGLSPKIEEAAILAECVHEGQRYGDKPYVSHLQKVWEILEAEEVHEALQAAAYLHDSLEDTSLTMEELRRVMGDEVAELVWAVTNEEGKNRKERNARTYPKIRSVPWAVTLKLADRIANVEECWSTRSHLLFMYKREYKDFRAALYTEDCSEVEARLWIRLDALLGS